MQHKRIILIMVLCIILIMVLFLCALIFCSSAESISNPVICGVHEKYLAEWAGILNVDRLKSKGINGNPYESLITAGSPDIL